jgi:hypothetical protein
LRERFGTWARPDQRRIIMRWCDWSDAVLASPGPAVLVHGNLHGDNQVWDRGWTIWPRASRCSASAPD